MSPFMSWHRWAAEDVHPIVAEMKDKLTNADQLVAAIAAIGPEGFVGWLAEECGKTFGFGTPFIPPDERTELIRRLNSGLTIDLSHVEQFAEKLVERGFLTEARRVARALTEWMGAASSGDAKRRGRTVASFINESELAQYLRRRTLTVYYLREDHPVPMWEINDILARAVWEVLDRLSRNVVEKRCPGCGVAFMPRRQGQVYDREACRRYTYDRQLAHDPRRREYQRLYKQRKRLLDGGLREDHPDVKRLTREIAKTRGGGTK